MNNILDILYQKLLVGVDSLSVPAYTFLTRTALALNCPMILAGVAWIKGSREVLTQISLALAGLLIAFVIPLDGTVSFSPIVKLWLSLIAVINIVAFPMILPRIVTPYEHQQKIAGGILYTLILGLFTINLFTQ